MAKKKEPLSRPMISSENKELELIGLAVEAAEQKLRDGTASSQLITHYLNRDIKRKREELENAKLEKEIKLLESKAKAIEDAAKADVDYGEVLIALKRYTGRGEYDE